MSAAYRLVAFTIPACTISLLLLLAQPMQASAADRIDELPVVRQLREELRTTSNPDSLRFVLAVAYRNTGTVDGRLRARDIFEKIRPKYFNDPRYQMELGRTLLEGGSRDAARRCFTRAVGQAPDNPTYRVLCGRLLLPSVVRYQDDAIAQEALEILGGAKGPGASDRDILYLRSLYLCISRNLAATGRTEKSVMGRTLAEEILSRNAKDSPVCLLDGVHGLDLGDAAEADYCFRLGLLNASAETRVAYYEPTYCAPESVLARIASLPDSLKVPTVAAYWESVDPTPLTPINEVQLEYWKRMTLADVLFEEPGLGTRGWETPRGEILVRYGYPQIAMLTLAQFQLGNANVQEDVKLKLRRMKLPVLLTMEMDAPKQSWHYDFGGADLQFDFVDADLRDHFTSATPDAYQRTTQSIPFVPMNAYAGDVRSCFIAATGLRDPDRDGSRATIDFAVPPWIAEDRWWDGATYTVSVIDAQAQRSVLRSDSLRPAILHPFDSKTGLAAATTTAHVAAGRYTLEVVFDSERAKGAFTVPIEVRAFGRDLLQLSDIRLLVDPRIDEPGAESRQKGIPNPTGAILEGAAARVTFEIYNLKTDPMGIARYRTRYVLLPQPYVREFARQMTADSSRVGADARFGGYGRTLGGVTLTADNYADVDFPVAEVDVAPSSRGIGAIRVETAGLRCGLYALLVVVTDVSSGRMTWSQMPLRILSAADLEKYLSGR
jgi:GWxTD domain-containing protein